MSEPTEEPSVVSDDVETRFLGRFDPLEVPIILDVLREHGIFAMTKVALGEPESETGYPFLNEGRGSVLVDRTRLDDARKIMERELPARLDELRAGLGVDQETDSALDDLVPFGWLEPDVARVLLEMLADVGIGAAPEYPLDLPPPPYAREDGRVRVHVEELLIEEANEVLENEVREAMAARGIAFAEPLLGTDES